MVEVTNKVVINSSCYRRSIIIGLTFREFRKRVAAVTLKLYYLFMVGCSEPFFFTAEENILKIEDLELYNNCITTETIKFLVLL